MYKKLQSYNIKERLKLKLNFGKSKIFFEFNIISIIQSIRVIRYCKVR